jgi:hypothetical protein
VTKWRRMSLRPDNQEVGLEAAILERVRNSSLVEWSGAENDRGSSHVPKPWGVVLLRTASVDERRARAEA